MTLAAERATLHRLRRSGFFPTFVSAVALTAGVVGPTASDGAPAAAMQAPAAAGAICPTRDAVWAQVAALIGRERLPQPDPPPALVIRDRGARYVVGMAARSREYIDDARNCDQRAQVAGVFVALTLVPPQFLLAQPPQPQPPRPKPPRPPPAPPATAVTPPRQASATSWLRIELAPWVGAAIFPDGGRAPSLATGGNVQAIFGAGRVAAVLGGGASLPTDVATAAAPDGLRERRFVADAGLRLVWRGTRWDASLDLLAALAALRITTAGGVHRDAAEWGARTAAILSTAVPPWSVPLMPFFGLFADVSLTPRRLALEPTGVVARTSFLRAGVTIGVAWRNL